MIRCDLHEELNRTARAVRHPWWSDSRLCGPSPGRQVKGRTGASGKEGRGWLTLGLGTFNSYEIPKPVSAPAPAATSGFGNAYQLGAAFP